MGWRRRKMRSEATIAWLRRLGWMNIDSNVEGLLRSYADGTVRDRDITLSR